MTSIIQVYIVTGANRGVGKDVARVLFSKHARVYIGARSESKAQDAIKEIREAHPESKGDLVCLYLDLSDLTTIKTAAQQFLDAEDKLHVLINNAALMCPEWKSETKQGYEMQLGVNNIGPELFTRLVTPALVATAKTEPAGNVRVVWVASSAAEGPFTPPGGVPLDNINYKAKPEEHDQMARYGISKAGNYFQCVEYAKRHRADGIVSVSLNPGNLDSDLWQFQGGIARTITRSLFLHQTIKGAYTELFAGFSPEVTMENTGGYSELTFPTERRDGCAWEVPARQLLTKESTIVIPWGRISTIRNDLQESAKTKEEGGTGVSAEFIKYIEEQIKPYE